jgi:hypothetical protein
MSRKITMPSDSERVGAWLRPGFGDYETFEGSSVAAHVFRMVHAANDARAASFAACGTRASSRRPEKSAAGLTTLPASIRWAFDFGSGAKRRLHPRTQSEAAPAPISVPDGEHAVR